MSVVASYVYRGGVRQEAVALDGAPPAFGDDEFVWVGLFEPTMEEIEGLARTFGLHPLAVEDALNAHQVPKVEVYGDQIFVIAKTAHLEGDKIRYGETSITTAALRMYAQVVHQEAQALGVRAQMLEVCSPVCTPANAANACIEWPSSLLVGRRVVSLLDGCRDNRAIVRCDSSDAELPRGLLHLDVPPLWRDTAGVA